MWNNEIKWKRSKKRSKKFPRRELELNIDNNPALEAGHPNWSSG